MNKTPILLRSIFAVCVVAVFVWSMFPMTQADFYETFLKLTQDPNDPKVTELVANAKAKQEQDKFKYPYPSKAIEAAANEIIVDGAPMNIVRFLKPSIVKQQKLRSNSDAISLVRKNAAGAIRLGIDLNGGAEFMLKLNADEKVQDNFEKFRDNAIETLRKRLESQNYYECDLSPAGGDLVSVRVPVVSEDEKSNLEKLILRSAKLEFRLTHPDSTNQADLVRQAYANWNGNKQAVSLEDYYRTTYLLQHPELASFELLVAENIDNDGTRTLEYELVARKVEMEGNEIKNADVRMTEYGQREIVLEFTGEGAKQFGRVTTDHVGKRLAIVLDGQLYSAPNLREPILGGTAQITGSFSEDDARSVANALVSGSLPFEITIVSRSDIEASVGSETIRKSIWSGIAGTVLVMIFMLIYYRTAGMVANISLVVNALVMLGAVAAFDVTLTLPGIAGIVLTIGMAVDANVLIYERMREEIRQGKSVTNAVNIGFNRAFSAIFDSNLTTLFVALILFWQGSGAIKGFAITLAIGIFTTLFTAVFLTRILFDLIIRIMGKRLKTLNMLQFCADPKIDFIALRKIGFGLSIVAVLFSIILMCVRGSDMLGIDFTGGSQILVQYVSRQADMEQISSNEIEKYLQSKGFDAKASYKITTDTSTEGAKLLEIIVRSDGESVSDETGNKIIEEMDKAYPHVIFTKQSQSTLGALIGAAFTKSAIWALLWAMIGMVIYLIIRFQFSYSVAANIALVHDVLVSMGIYLAFGGQLTLQVVASLLTLIGYSVNDTIVIFDRQRENLTLMNGSTYLQVVNTSLNQTLGRTILTSTSVVLILVTQLLLGGEGIRDFVAVMLIGCLVGCYSSIFVSPMITAYWHRKERNILEEAKSAIDAEPATEEAKS